MRSQSRSSLSEVVLEFEWGESMDTAGLDVRERLGLVELPREAEIPRVLRFDPSLEPIMRLGFYGDRDLDELRQLADRWLKPRLESVVGVAAAKVRGGLDAEIVVEADEDRLAALGLTPADLALALRQENVNQPGGTLRDFNAIYLVRTMHEFEDLDQIRRTVVREMPVRDGSGSRTWPGSSAATATATRSPASAAARWWRSISTARARPTRWRSPRPSQERLEELRRGDAGGPPASRS